MGQACIKMRQTCFLLGPDSASFEMPAFCKCYCSPKEVNKFDLSFDCRNTNSNGCGNKESSPGESGNIGREKVPQCFEAFAIL